MRGISALSAAAVATLLLLSGRVQASTGALDRTFNGDGKVLTRVAGADRALDVALAPGGRIVVMGTSNRGATLARYRLDGRLDHSFSGDGKLVAPLPRGPHWAFRPTA